MHDFKDDMPLYKKKLHFKKQTRLKHQNPHHSNFLKVSNEKELEKSDSNHHCNIIFDSTGHFIMYATMIGIKLVNLYTNKG